MTPIDLTSGAFFRDPYPSYARLRAEAPVLFDETLGVWLVSRYDDVRTAGHDLRLSSRRADVYIERLPEEQRRILGPVVAGLSLWMLFRDRPEHARLRALVSKAFTPRHVDGYSRAIEAKVAALFGPRGEHRMDFVAELAAHLPAWIIAEMLGIPEAERATLKAQSDQIIAWTGRAGAGGRAAAAWQDPALEAWRVLSERFREIIEDRRGAPRSDLISALVAAEDNGSQLSNDELVAMCLLMLAAGHASMSHTLSSATLGLLLFPDELDRLRADHTLVPTAIEELARFGSATQYSQRTASEDLVLVGHPVTKGARVRLLWASANRDETVFTDPDRVDVGREGNKHLAFGAGPHFCIGAALARLELRITVQALCRLEGLRIDCERAALRWDDNAAFRGVAALPIAYRNPSL